MVEPSGIEPPTGPHLQSVGVRQGSPGSGFHRQQKDLHVPEVRWRPLRFAEVRPELGALLPRLLPRERGPLPSAQHNGMTREGLYK
jgi:hypothetical protein